jgi:hypothetical protein
VSWLEREREEDFELGKVLGPMDQKLAQSRKLDKRCWLWVRKGTSLVSISVLGFQASAVNVTRFGSTVRKLVPTRTSFCDERSFAEVVKEGAMARDTRKVVLDLGRDRQGSWVKEENQFRNYQEGEGSGGFRGGINMPNNDGWREGQRGYQQGRPCHAGQRFMGHNFHTGRGGPPNPRFGNQGNGYKRGHDDRKDQREMDPRAKVGRDQDFGRGGGGGQSHCFNCNRDGYFPTSCPSPSITVRRMDIDQWSVQIRRA